MALDNPLSWAQVAALALTAGWSPADAVIASSITEPESARIVNNVQQGQPYATTGWGLWQITPGDSEPQFGVDDAMLNGLNNARAAHAKWQGAGGWSPWTTWQKGFNVPYIPAATQAVAAVSNLSVSALHRLVDEAAGGHGLDAFTPDHAIARMDAYLRQFLRAADKQLVYQHMALMRTGGNGWLP